MVIDKAKQKRLKKAACDIAEYMAMMHRGANNALFTPLTKHSNSKIHTGKLSDMVENYKEYLYAQQHDRKLTDIVPVPTHKQLALYDIYTEQYNKDTCKSKSAMRLICYTGVRFYAAYIRVVDDKTEFVVINKTTERSTPIINNTVTDSSNVKIKTLFYNKRLL